MPACLTHLNYKIDKAAHVKYFWDNYDRGGWHQFNDYQRNIWWKIFQIDEMADPIIKDLNLEGLDVRPRYSFQFKNTSLPPHIDIDEIIGINLNLMPWPVTIHMEGKPYEYEAIIADVGHVMHSIEPVDYDRLILKLAIRAPLEEVLDRCEPLLVPSGVQNTTDTK